MRPLRCSPASAFLLTLAAALPAAAQISPAVERWSPIGPEGGTITALAVAPGSPQTVYAGTAHGLVFRSSNGGASWTLTGEILPPYLPEEPITVLAVDPGDPAVVYAGTCHFNFEPPFMFGGTFRSTDGGRTWALSLDYSALSFCEVRDLALDPGDPDTVFAATPSGLFDSGDRGTTWEGDYELDPWAVEADPATPGTWYVLDSANGFLKSTDGGATWTPRNAGLPAGFLAGLEADPHTPGALYVQVFPPQNGGPVAPVYRSLDGGESWAPAAAGLGGRRVNDLAAGASTAGGTVLYAATADGVFRSEDRGQSWTAPPSQTAARGVLVVAAPTAAASAGRVYAGTRHAGVFRSTSSGGSWGAANSGLTGQLVTQVAIAPSDPAVLYAWVHDLGVRRSADGGATWQTANAGLPPVDPVFLESFRLTVDPRAPNTVLASRSGSIWKTSNGGASGRPTTGAEAVGLSIRALAYDPRNNRTVYAVGFASTYPAPPPCIALKSTNGGDSWSCLHGMTAGANTLLIDPNAPATLYAGAFNRVQVSTDAGGSWNDFSQGLPAAPELSSLVLSSGTPATLLIGLRPGLFRRQGSALWAQVAVPFTLVNELAVAPSDPATVYARAWAENVPYRVYRSFNTGTSWRLVPQLGLPGGAIEGLVVHPRQPRVLHGLTRAGIYRLSLTTAQ